MEQLDYRFKTKSPISVSSELLGSLVVLEDDYFLKQTMKRTDFENKLKTLLDGEFWECDENGSSISKIVDDLLNELFNYHSSKVALREYLQNLIQSMKSILNIGPLFDEDKIAIIKMF